jgi:hypothetical protein
MTGSNLREVWMYLYVPGSLSCVVLYRQKYSDWPNQSVVQNSKCLIDIVILIICGLLLRRSPQLRLHEVEWRDDQ